MTMLDSAVLEALSVGSLPDVEWSNQDDLCDCTYQRIGFWTNPYIGETHEIRLCCVWAELGKQYPQFVRTTPAFYDYNKNEWVTEVAEWNGEADMPKAIWHRQLARRLNIPLEEARRLSMPPPRGRKRIPFFLVFGSQEFTVDLGSWQSV
jgi:hypothetical protein